MFQSIHVELLIQFIQCVRHDGTFWSRCFIVSNKFHGSVVIGRIYVCVKLIDGGPWEFKAVAMKKNIQIMNRKVSFVKDLG